jgi:hypothetical protein
MDIAEPTGAAFSYLAVAMGHLMGSELSAMVMFGRAAAGVVQVYMIP